MTKPKPSADEEVPLIELRSVGEEARQVRRIYRQAYQRGPITARETFEQVFGYPCDDDSIDREIEERMQAAILNVDSYFVTVPARILLALFLRKPKAGGGKGRVRLGPIPGVRYEKIRLSREAHELDVYKPLREQREEIMKRIRQKVERLTQLKRIRNPKPIKKWTTEVLCRLARRRIWQLWKLELDVPAIRREAHFWK